jgi:hypothetical protein
MAVRVPIHNFLYFVKSGHWAAPCFLVRMSPPIWGLITEFSMKTIFSALVVLGLSIVAAPCFAADARNVSVVNETGYAIKFLGFNGPDDGLDEWENELDETLENQAQTYVEFNEQDDGCVWNIKVDWANYNESVLWKNVNLCRFNVLRLRYDPGTKTTSFVAE